MSKRMTIREARLMANGAEIQDVENVSTETVRLVAEVLGSAKRINGDIQTAHTRALEELDFRIRNGY